ncbi:hypothetical protein C8R44DRAFT_958834 [Mycena epipterygia]|nr:hypothetical protein C8R44DRAFT_958834 [Mycena epipterygia]
MYLGGSSRGSARIIIALTTVSSIRRQSVIWMLETPQTHYLRRLLGLNPRSMLAVLFTETGIMPIRIPEAAVDLPRAGFRESLRLAELGHSCWAGDLHWVLASLATSVTFDSPALRSAEGIDGIIKDVEKACDRALQSEIVTLLKTHFLKNRLEVNDSGKLTTITLDFRHYLRLVSWQSRGCGMAIASGGPLSFATCSEFRAQVQTASAYDFLMHCRDVTKCLACFMYEVFTVFAQKEMLIPPSHFIHGGDR